MTAQFSSASVVLAPKWGVARDRAPVGSVVLGKSEKYIRNRPLAKASATASSTTISRRAKFKSAAPGRKAPSAAASIIPTVSAKAGTCSVT